MNDEASAPFPPPSGGATPFLTMGDIQSLRWARVIVGAKPYSSQKTAFTSNLVAPLLQIRSTPHIDPITAGAQRFAMSNGSASRFTAGPEGL